MNITFDTNVLISSTLWENSVSQKLLFKLIRQEVNIFSSTEILTEYKKVLKRDFDYSNEEILRMVEKVLLFVRLVNPTEKIDIVKDDPDDNKIIECAIASNSDCIITYDKRHLLPIKEYKGIKIITPEDLLKILD